MDSRLAAMLRVAAVLGIGLVTAGAQYSCSGNTGTFRDDLDDSGEGATFSTTLVLRDASGAESYRFAQGDNITFELTVRNRTDSTVVREFGSGSNDFLVIADGSGALRWRALEGATLPAVVTVVTWQPGESQRFTREWNLVTLSGAMLPKGNYDARGVMPFPGYESDRLAPDELGSSLRFFTLR